MGLTTRCTERTSHCRNIRFGCEAWMRLHLKGRDWPWGSHPSYCIFCLVCVRVCTVWPRWPSPAHLETDGWCDHHTCRRAHVSEADARGKYSQHLNCAWQRAEIDPNNMLSLPLDVYSGSLRGACVSECVCLLGGVSKRRSTWTRYRSMHWRKDECACVCGGGGCRDVRMEWHQGRRIKSAGVCRTLREEQKWMEEGTKAGEALNVWSSLSAGLPGERRRT